MLYIYIKKLSLLLPRIFLNSFFVLSSLTLFHSTLTQKNTLSFHLPTCSSYQDYIPHSFDHEYTYNASDLAHQFRHNLGDLSNIFLIGASTSEHQCSKQCTPAICDWARFADQKKLKKPTDAEYVCNWWDNYETYIDQLKNIVGINALRISLEWPLIQPDGPDSFNLETLDHYAQVIAYLIKNNITPVICFHHYTNPCWFADKGGFEKNRNCPFFAHYCTQTYHYVTKKLMLDKTVYDAWINLEKKGRGILWATFNSPEGVAFKGYHQKAAPPSHENKNGLYWVSRVLKNMMESHVQAYQQIKAITLTTSYHSDLMYISKPRIGFLKNITQFDPAPHLSLVIKQITRLSCAIANDLNNECIYNFFTKGEFCTKTPLTIAPHTNYKAPFSLDWIGLNYYSNQHMRLFGRITASPGEPDYTDNSNYRIYPYGLFRALAEINYRIAQPLSIPIYVTENGIATQNHTKRNFFYKAYLHELLRALQHHIPVYGYLTWTAFDNYEWPKTNNTSPQSDIRQYGLTTVSPDGLTLTLKPGAYYFKTFATSFLSAYIKSS